MSQIVVDADLRSRLNGLVEEMTFCDEAGNVLGHFVPAPNGKASIVLLPEDQCPYSQEELQRQLAETGGMTLREFWKSVGRE